MAGFSYAEKIIKENKDKGTVISIFEQTDKDEHNKKYFEYIYKNNSGENIKIIDYGSDIRCSKNIKEGDKVVFKIIGEYEAILLKEKEEYNTKDMYKTIREESDYYINIKVEDRCYDLQKEIEERVRELEQLREDKIIRLETYNGDIIVDDKETEGTKVLIKFKKDCLDEFDLELEEELEN